ICGSGVGASVAANKLKGIRAAVCHDCYSAHQGVEHDDMNVLVLGSRIIGVKLAEDLVRAFLSASFTNEERHKRRLTKFIAPEKTTGILLPWDSSEFHRRFLSRRGKIFTRFRHKGEVS